MTSTIASTTTVPSSTATIDPTDERNQPTDPAEVHDALYDYTLPYGLPGLIGHFFFFVETSLEAMTIWPDNLSRNHLIKPIVTGVSVAGNIVVACITMFMCRHTWQLVVVRNLGVSFQTALRRHPFPLCTPFENKLQLICNPFF
jgi:hypothetical protein